MNLEGMRRALARISVRPRYVLHGHVHQPQFPLAGAGITEFAPSSPDAASDDLGVILRVVGALTARSPVPGAAAVTAES